MVFVPMHQNVPLHTVAVVSDIHFDNEFKEGWQAFRQWHSEIRPQLTVLLGDVVDLNMLSTYPQGSDDPVYAIDQIKAAIAEVNPLVEEADAVKMMPGNHEERWMKAVWGPKAQQLRGAKGLTLREQMYLQGLDSRIQWVKEKANSGLWIGKPREGILARHGHRQSGRFGAKHMAAKALQQAPGINQICGHIHRAQVMHQTVLGKTYVAITNPHMSGEHDYNHSPDWQRGFTVLHFYGATRLRDCTRFNYQQCIMQDDGQFYYEGKIYGA